jgi:hypothetical protein
MSEPETEPAVDTEARKAALEILATLVNVKRSRRIGYSGQQESQALDRLRFRHCDNHTYIEFASGEFRTQRLEAPHDAGLIEHGSGLLVEGRPFPVDIRGPANTDSCRTLTVS